MVCCFARLRLAGLCLKTEVAEDAPNVWCAEYASSPKSNVLVVNIMPSEEEHQGAHHELHCVAGSVEILDRRGGAEAHGQ